MTTETTAKKQAHRPSQKNQDESARANGNGQSTRQRRELTLDEMSLRAYKMTYEQLHGSKKGLKQRWQC
jgi:hypothetical protein